MKKRIWLIAAMSALLLVVGYQAFFTDQPMGMKNWYQGQDITEGSDPMPFDASRYTAASTPERDEQGNLPSDIYRLYVDAAARGELDQALLTEDSRAVFAARPPLREELRDSVVSYRECSGGEELALNDLAVLRYPPDLPRCPPLLFRLEMGLWRIGLADMRDFIGRDQHNRWLFKKGKPPVEYAFAFAGWRFDSSGSPQIP